MGYQSPPWIFKGRCVSQAIVPTDLQQQRLPVTKPGFTGQCCDRAVYQLNLVKVDQVCPAQTGAETRTSCLLREGLMSRLIPLCRPSNLCRSTSSLSVSLGEADLQSRLQQASSGAKLSCQTTSSAVCAGIHLEVCTWHATQTALQVPLMR